MKILFLSFWFPYPHNNGSKLRIYNLLQNLALHHEITLISFADQSDSNPEVSKLLALCQDVHIVPYKPFNPRSVRARLGFFSWTPRSISDTYSPEMAACINQVLTKQNFDLVIASQWNTASYAHCFKDVAALFEEVEIGIPYERYAHATSFRERIRNGLTWLKLKSYLARLLPSFQACTVVSKQERQLLLTSVPGYRAVEIVPNCINLADYKDTNPPSPQANSLIFTGSFRYSANYDAMVWFLEQVYPRIQAEIADVKLIITGDHDDLPLPPATNVTMTGFVDDIRPVIASASVSLAPLRVGGGTRLKILEAMALKTPVVATSKGAEGLDVTHGQHLLLADTPETYAQMVIRMLKDAELRRNLVDNAYQVVREKYDWAVVLPRYLELVESVAQS